MGAGWPLGGACDGRMIGLCWPCPAEPAPAAPASQVDAERIKELYGGGDWHMAYMCFYRKMDVLTLDDK